MEERKTVLSVEHLSVKFTQYERGFRQIELPAIRDLCLTVKEGEMVAVVGSSGSGKSLLAHAVMGILPYNAVTGGRIDYDGVELTEKRIRALRGREIVLVPQSVSYLDPLMKAGAQVRKGRKDSESRRKCREVLARYGLGKETEELYPFELSGGMQQRVGIAAAMLLNPRLLLADEPTSALDVSVQKQVVEEILMVRKSFGTAIVMVSHNLGVIEAMADRVLVMRNGEMLEYGETRKILTDPQTAYTKELLAAVPRLRRK